MWPVTRWRSVSLSKQSKSSSFRYVDDCIDEGQELCTSVTAFEKPVAAAAAVLALVALGMPFVASHRHLRDHRKSGRRHLHLDVGSYQYICYWCGYIWMHVLEHTFRRSEFQYMLAPSRHLRRVFRREDMAPQLPEVN